MGAFNKVPSIPGFENQRAALEAALASQTFSKASRLAALLRYLCARHFEGEADSIKEYNIATDLFGRPPDFDQSTDAIVRVEMHRLRKRLKDYYAGEGADQPLEIVIHIGKYLPEFIERQAPEQLDLSIAPVQLAPTPASGWRRGRSLGVAAVAILAIAAALLMIGSRQGGSLQQVAPRAASTALAGVPVNESVRILCGSSGRGYRDRQASDWAADVFFSGGSSIELPAQPLYRTRDSFLFRTARTGDFSYKIPLKPGIYEMRLYFADTSYAPGAAMEGGENNRVFNVAMNGAPLLREFDIIADAGPNTADVKVFKDVTPAADGYLRLDFSKAPGAPLINAIELVPGIPHLLRPIHMVMQDNAYVDRANVVWHPDNYFLGGHMVAHAGAVRGTEDPEIYGRERYGNFTYAIPVGAGRYGLTLHFVETFWGPTNPGGGGTGNRVFDVYCNGVALLRKLDIFKEAGAHRALPETFHKLEPNAQGKLLLSFVPVKNYATLSAIEVVDESK